MRGRDIGTVCRDAISRLDDGVASSEVLDYLASEVVRVVDDAGTGLVQISSLTHDTLTRIEEAMKRHGKLPGISTGFSKIDNMTGGFRPSEMCILAARTSIGKTAFALNVAENMARHKVKVAFFSLEMSREELMDRLTSSVSGIPHQRIRKGALSNDGDLSRLSDAIARLHEETMWICDEPNASFSDIRNMSRMFCSHGGQVVIVDYMTLIQYGDSKTPRPERIGQLSKDLKAMARELKVPVIVLSQLNRESEGATPTLSTLRQSGEIEEDADMIMLMHRGRDKAETELIIAKHRNGPTGKIMLRFGTDTLRFNEVIDCE